MCDWVATTVACPAAAASSRDGKQVTMGGEHDGMSGDRLFHEGRRAGRVVVGNPDAAAFARDDEQVAIIRIGKSSRAAEIGIYGCI